MNFKELHEGTEPKMPGAPSGIKIMTPQQFVASAGDSKPDEESEEGVAEGSLEEDRGMKQYWAFKREWRAKHGKDADVPAYDSQEYNAYCWRQGDKKQGVAEGTKTGNPVILKGCDFEDVVNWLVKNVGPVTMKSPNYYNGWQGKGWVLHSLQSSNEDGMPNLELSANTKLTNNQVLAKTIQMACSGQQGVSEGQEHLDRIRSLSGLEEATKLPAQTRELGGDEFQDYMKRIVGTPDVDKAGNVKVDKKGNEKYTTGKTKGDKYKMPYIHRSSVVSYLSPDGKTYDEDAVKKTLAVRPKALLKQNEKMKHSNGEFEQFFNVGFAALVGIALDEQTDNLIVVNTCPGAGSCKVDCFAMKGGKIQFKAAWQSDGRILTYLLNDPDGFFNQLSSEISREAQEGKAGDKKFPNGWQVTVRWHDAGDFFSPEYLDMALKMAAKHPDVRFYAYTKMAGAALAKKPDNFIINWSEGANTEQEKQVKAQDPKLDTTKNSRIVPEKLFYDLLAKDEKGNLKKTADGAWQPASPEALAEIKQRIAKEYGLSTSSILSYDEYLQRKSKIRNEWHSKNRDRVQQLLSKGASVQDIGNLINQELAKGIQLKYNVIVAPGEGDISANDPAVLSTLLLRH